MPSFKLYSYLAFVAVWRAVWRKQAQTWHQCPVPKSWREGEKLVREFQMQSRPVEKLFILA